MHTDTIDNKDMEQAFKNLLAELKPVFGRRPNLQSLIFLIGVQELGQLHRTFTKEEKQDLMHLAVCRLLSQCGFFEFDHIDKEGWPHYRPLQPMTDDLKGLTQQETLLKEQILHYFGKSW